MPLPHYHYFHHFEKDHELEEIFMNRVIETIAFSLVALFIPSYLYSLGYSLSESLSYLFYLFAFMTLSTFLGTQSYYRKGLVFNVFVSVLLYFAHFYVLFGFESGVWPVWLLAAFFGAGHAFYWVAINTDFIGHEHKRKTGRETALLLIAPKLGVLLGPLVGAYVLTAFGIQNLIYAVAGLLLLSLAPLLKAKPFIPKTGLERVGVFSGKPFKLWHAEFADGVMNAGVWAWTLYAFVVVGTFEGVGIVGALSALGGIILALLIGGFEDAHGSKTVLKSFSLANFLAWLAGALTLTPFAVYALTLLRGFTQTVFDLTLFKDFVDVAKKKDLLSFVHHREIVLCAGRLAMLGVVIMLPDALKFQAAFSLTALASASLYFYSPEK